MLEVTQTPCSNSKPCPDGGPCLEYGGTYLCTCQTGDDFNHNDLYPYGKSARELWLKVFLCDNVCVCVHVFFVFVSSASLLCVCPLTLCKCVCAVYVVDF